MLFRSYEDLKKSLIDEKDYKTIKQMYSDRIAVSEKTIETLKRELDIVSSANINSFNVYENIADNGGFTELTRKILVSLIDKIYLNGKNNISIVFKFDEDARLMEDYISKLPSGLQKESEVC